MTDAQVIRSRLADLQPLRLEVVDDSARHVGHAGARTGGGHFRVMVVSEAFVGLPTLARHRLVHARLGDLLPRSIHALSLRALTPTEL
ncbi:MAG: BolA family transcriptional regulator [Betaproteobacteria bacterium]|nr:BolA family transcriptional regulator [Betaproteobacteria bacterium]